MVPDYLVYTTTQADVARALYASALEDAAEGTPQYRIYMGAEGVQVGRRYVGSWRDGRWLIVATGSSAIDPWRRVSEVAQGLVEGESVARVDLQLTYPVADADELIRGLVPHPRYKASRVVNLSERGGTLYVGAAGSDKRLRVYNKSAQAGVGLAAGELVRVELQLRNHYADHALVVARAGGPRGLQAWWRQSVIGMVPALAYSLPTAEQAHIDVEPAPRGDTSYKAWIERCVVPALGKAALTTEWDEIKAMLLRAIDAQG